MRAADWTEQCVLERLRLSVSERLLWLWANDDRVHDRLWGQVADGVDFQAGTVESESKNGQRD